MFKNGPLEPGWLIVNRFLSEADVKSQSRIVNWQFALSRIVNCSAEQSVPICGIAFADFNQFALI